MRWVGHAACIGERRGACRVLKGNLKERDHLEDLDLDGRVVIKRIIIVLVLMSETLKFVVYYQVLFDWYSERKYTWVTTWIQIL
jgi:hypothetical protein